jgi:hypothetical protein
MLPPIVTKNLMKITWNSCIHNNPTLQHYFCSVQVGTLTKERNNKKKKNKPMKKKDK